MPVVSLEAGVIEGAIDKPFDGVTFTVGAESANVINVGMQFTRGGVDVGEICSAFAWMSDAADGDAVASAAADGGVAKGTDGEILIEHTANLVFELQTESDGDCDVDVTETGIDTWYLVVRLPNGTVAVSGAITFA